MEFGTFGADSHWMLAEIKENLEPPFEVGLTFGPDSMEPAFEGDLRLDLSGFGPVGFLQASLGSEKFQMRS